LFSFFLVAFTSLAILRYHLFEVRVIMTEILVVVMGLILLALTLFMETTRLKVLTILAFILFCVFGYLLIKTTHTEIRRREEMERLTKRLRKAYKNIKELSQMKTEFLKVVGHQLRTPVSIIRGLISMLEEGSVPREKKKKYTKELYLTSERLTTILEDILVAQRLVAEEYEIEKGSCDLAELLKDITEQFKPLAAKKRLKLLLEAPTDKMSKVSIDEETVEKIVSRLIDNAILYTSADKREKKEIIISYGIKKEGRKKFLAISVRDSGIGLNEHDKKNLFKLFFRGKKAVYVRPNGSGLGLFIVKKLAEAHKGKIEAESKGRGRGSTFTLILPV
jgi:two-component system sensor histidine kinase ResE